jgi:hypothetical protein
MKLTIKPIEKVLKSCFVVTSGYKHGTGNDDLYTYKTYTIHDCNIALLEKYLSVFEEVSKVLEEAIVNNEDFDMDVRFYNEKIDKKRKYKNNTVYTLKNLNLIDVNLNEINNSMYLPVIDTPYVILFENDALRPEDFACMWIAKVNYYDDDGKMYDVIDEDNPFFMK